MKHDLMLSAKRKARRQSGNVGIRILLAAITLVIIGAVIAYFLYGYQERLKENHRKAARISEYGLQSALEHLSVEPSWTQGFEKVPYDGGYYTVLLQKSVRNDTALLTVTSQGYLKSSTDSRECLLALSVVDHDSVWIQLNLH